METINEMRKVTSASKTNPAQESRLKCISADDAEATVRFVLKYQSKVFATAMEVLHDEAAATKATCAAFTRALLQLRQGIRTGQMESWLLWIARNEAVTRIHNSYGDATATDDTVAAAQNFLAQETYPRALLWRTHAGSNTAALPGTDPKKTRQVSHGRLPGVQAQPSWQAEGRDRSRSRKTDGSAASTLVIALVILVLLVFAWATMGLLAKNGMLSLPDLGYTWFSRHVFPLF